MVTREEYNEALDTVEAYHKQLFTDTVSHSSKARRLSNTPPLEWGKFQECSTRLQTVLRNVDLCNREHGCNLAIETMTWREFNNMRFAGRKSWEDFVELRGY